ncbi:hypothetical protein HMN09_00904000 [Mycena chlorophos]|uniref:Uncharacterized protein n=1 Tax=Mycena chlorophos TaxID=658473 RepID=A0A8H6SPT1_MYCCL|nr:hypothetical protein HMN09_00904000 [Mycena chlorophos]
MKQETAPLRIFHVGSRDYLRLSYHQQKTPNGLRFPQVGRGIPALAQHLLSDRRVRILRDCERRYTELSAVSESILALFSEGRHPGRLTREIRANAVACVTELEAVIREHVTDTFEEISQKLVELKAHLLQAVNDADENCLDAVEEFHRPIDHYNTLKATLTRQGAFREHNLNRVLTQKILPAIMADWNTVMNKEVPRLLKKLKDDIRREADAAEKRLVTMLQDKRIEFKELDAARRSLNLSGLLTGLVETSYGSITLAQREGTRSFAPIVQNQLREHYEEALTISGPGALKRMKESTAKFLENNSTQVFTAITQHLFQLLDDCISEAQKQFDEAASEIPTRLRLTLIDDLDLSPESRLAREDIVKVALDLRPRLQRMEMELEQMREGEPKAEPMD